MDSDYLPRLQKWIGRQKYKVDESFNSCILTIANCFTFNLPKSSKKDVEIIREELASLKQEKQRLMLDHKLFSHYFFNFWREKSRDTLQEKKYLLDSIIESPAHLYNICEGVCCEQETHFLQGSLIGFKQPVAFLYQTGQAERITVKHAGDFREDLFEVFVSGRGHLYQTAQISSKVVREEKGREGTIYFHRCDLPLVPGQKYQVFTPKFF